METKPEIQKIKHQIEIARLFLKNMGFENVTAVVCAELVALLYGFESYRSLNEHCLHKEKTS